MAIVPTNSYVKFIRGTTAAFDALVNKDANTLYFISDAVDSTSGKLYLGSKLISGGGGSSSVVNLTDLADVVINTVGNNQLLVYNAATSRWENKSINALVGVMTGATASSAGAAGLVPAPAAGAQHKFLRGDGTWVTLDIDENLTNGILDEAEKKINNLNSSIENLIAQVNELDTTELNNRIKALELTVNGDTEHTGLISIVSTLQSDITNLNSEIANIHTAIDTGEFDAETGAPITIIQKVTTLSTALNNIDSRVSTVEASVKWSELTED